jgi:hypothetical protein
MKLKILWILYVGFAFNSRATTNQWDLPEKWSESLRSLSCIQTQRVSGAEYTKREKAANEIVGKALSLAFASTEYDQADSFLTMLLNKPDIAHDVVCKICRIQLNKMSLSNGEHGRLCNYIIHVLFENRESNPLFFRGIEAVLFQNEHPEVYTSETKEIVKNCILSEQIHFFYADIVGITTNKEVQSYLREVGANSGVRKYDGSYQAWLATCMLAKLGDKASYQKVRQTADNLSDLLKAQHVTLGMAYIGDKEMVLRLIKMLKSDLRKWHGEDAIPEESQLSQEAASVLSLCIKGFPAYDTFSTFKDRDKAKCLQWAEEHKNTFIIDNKPSLYYFKNTKFNQLRARQFHD